MKNSSIPIIMAVASLVFLINSCGGGGGGGSSSSGSSSASKTELEGTWSHGCLVDEEGDAATRTNVYSGNSYTFTTTSYTDTECNSVDLIGVNKGSFSIGESFTVSEGVVAKKNDYTVGTQEVTIVNPQTAAISTLGEICGTTWEVNQAAGFTTFTALTGINCTWVTPKRRQVSVRPPVRLN